MNEVLKETTTQGLWVSFLVPFSLFLADFDNYLVLSSLLTSVTTMKIAYDVFGLNKYL